MTNFNRFIGKAPALAALFGTALLAGSSILGSAAQAQAAAPTSLGPNVLVFNPSMPTSQIQAAFDAISAQQLSNQFGTQRYALLFEPGTYGTDTPLNLQVGFYTEVAGLGASPDAVVINGTINVYNQCDQNGCTALDNFWRSLSNLRINVSKPNSGCYYGEFWAVSQAAPWRRMDVNGQTTLMDYCTGPSYASGGFIANSSANTIINGSQQQFLMRNGSVTNWTNGVWNQVFAGVIGAPPQSYPNPSYTNLATNPVSREKPFLFVDANGNYQVFAPKAQTATSDTNWATDATAGRTLPLCSFFVATPATRQEDIDEALDHGKNLLLTPGVYALRHALEIDHPDTVVLGLGFPTLVPQHGSAAITVGDVNGVQIAGMIVDAGPRQSDVLVRIGHKHGREHGDGEDRHAREGDGSDNGQHGANKAAADPVALSDVFFRIGGATTGSARTSLEVNSDNVLLDDIWAWRADHGAGAAWTVNTADHGVVVNGDNVSATGLAVEHYQKEQVLWNGNGGQTIFYQSELPYDPPSQAAWMDGTANGYPSYVVGSDVSTHQAFGLGIYSFFSQGINIIEDNAMVVPTVPGVVVHDAGTVFLNGSGQITHVIDGVGTTASQANGGSLNPVVLYP